LGWLLFELIRLNSFSGKKILAGLLFLYFFIPDLVFLLIKISKFVKVYRTYIILVSFDVVLQIIELSWSNIINVSPQKIIWEELIIFTFPCRKTLQQQSYENVLELTIILISLFSFALSPFQSLWFKGSHHLCLSWWMRAAWDWNLA
jgi:hypothetical protein